MKALERSPIEIVMNVDGLYEGNLIPYYQALVADSTGRSNPYHNARHGLHVMCAVYAGAKFHNLPPREVRNLCIAAPFHDINHSGKSRGKDSLEIEVALMTLRQYIQPEDDGELRNISDIIRATEYPYVMPKDALSVSQQLIRDADMSQNFSDVWIQQSWFGLAEELGYDPIAFLGVRPAFLRNIEFHSEWGRAVLEPERLPKILEAEEYIRALGEKMPPEYRLAA